ncbi:MAG: hypothetical protein L3J82_08880 [Planctomycetes bacterium]|nr:hypothetical protein [Planctomycetota bacterium]
MHYGWVANSHLRQQARDARHDGATAHRKAETLKLDIEDAMARQALIIRSLLTLLERKGLTNDDEFRALVNEVDLSDGKLDGKYAPEAKPTECPKCLKVNGRRAIKCMYCGESLTGREII